MSELVGNLKEGKFYNRGSLIHKSNFSNNIEIINSKIIEDHRTNILKEIKNRV